MKSTLLTWERGTFLTDNNYLIKLEMKLFRVPGQKVEFPEGYKFQWIAYNENNPSERVLFDNHHGKSPHWHVNEEERFFTWQDLTTTRKLFFEMVYQKFGYFNYE